MLGAALAVLALGLVYFASTHGQAGAVVAPAALAEGALATFQLAASVAGRGRGMPGVRLAPWIRLLFALAVGPLVAADGQVLAGAAVFLALCVAVGRLRGPGVAVLGLLVERILFAWRAPGWVGVDALNLALVASILAVGIATRRLGLDVERLERVGITAWAASDLGLVPVALTFLMGFVLPSGHAHWWLPPVCALLTILALRYLSRVLLATEARHAARGLE